MKLLKILKIATFGIVLLLNACQEPELLHEGTPKAVKLPSPWAELPELNAPASVLPSLVLFEHLRDPKMDSEQLRALRKRGLTPTFDIDSATPESLRVAQEAGIPIILSGRRAFAPPDNAWPYNLTDDPSQWAHQYPADMLTNPKWKHMPCPLQLEGWEIASDQFTQRFNALKSAGIDIAGLWLDFENEPSHADPTATLNCLRCQKQIPQSILDDKNAFLKTRRNLWITLHAQYIAEPFRKLFPDATTTNWSYVLSGEPFPALDWKLRPRPATLPNSMNATNPIAYGVDIAFKRLSPNTDQLSADEVTRIYSWIILQQVFADAAHRKALGTDMKAIPWVARHVNHKPETPLPMLSREAYRECLRHIWLSGIAGLQVFEPPIMGGEAHAQMEIEDNLIVYREMLEYADFVREGTPLALALPDHENFKVAVSGLQLGSRTLIRATSYDGKTHAIEVTLPNQQTLTIKAPPGGTYHWVDGDN